MKVQELALALGVAFEGDGALTIEGAAPLEAAGRHQLSFIANRKAALEAPKSAAGCLIVPLEFPNDAGRALLRASDPRTAFARSLMLLYPPRVCAPGVHPTAVIDAAVELGGAVSIAAKAVVGAGTRIGHRARIGAGSVIGRDVLIGDDVLLHANVTIYDGVRIGARSVLHSGAVIGADGFSFNMAGGRWEKFPQVGTVEIGEDVEIGANCTVDRAALSATTVGDGTKFDNMVHIGHNCRVGRHVVIAAQTGIAGGCEIGDYAVIGGQVGMGEKVRVESRAVVGSGAGLLNSKIVRAGQVMWGTPARPLKEHLAQLANLAKLPELRARVEKLEGK